MSFCYEYPRPAVAADIILVAKNSNDIQILLIQRKNTPFQNMWAFPGGFMESDEPILRTAHRELLEETGIKVEKLDFLWYYDGVNRDPRGRTIGFAFYSILDHIIEAKSGDDAANACWFNIDSLPPLAFDHEKIIYDLKQKILTLH